MKRAVLLAIAVAAACSQPLPESGAIVIDMPTSPNNLDPRYGTDGASALAQQLIFNDLIGFDEHMRLAPELASSWETTDYRTYLVHLKRGVHFHDGHELTSKDVVYTFTSILDPKMASPFRGGYRDLDTVSALDTYTVQFVCKQPTGAFLINLHMKIIPDGASRDLRDHPVGTGPYEFARYAVDDTVEVKRFADYFGGAARNPGVALKIVPDDIMRGLELRKRTADLVINDLVPDIAYELQRDGLALTTVPGLDYQYLAFNFRDPILQDLRVRRAIGFAINRQSIVEYLGRGLATLADGMFPPSHWAFEPNVFRFAYDPARAKALLDEAGYRDPDGDGPQPRLTLTLKTTNQEFQRLQAAVIQDNLKQVGIKLEIRTYEFATLYADVLKGNFQMYTLQWVGGAVADPDILRRVFHSQMVPPAGFNRGHFSDAEVDRLLDDAARATDLESRRQRYARVQERLAELAPYISLWHKTNFALAQPELDGVQLSPAADLRFLKNVSRRPGAARPPAN
ncbi:MAG TPA: ABC transporter substrate-binding protein [Vicinamibacterales bacterium]|jgi:peptide/nickel transport system substrate-binding protein|nr:ABC transporter substrate-binding protein [Vicinamibacterales bacterium]